MKLALSSIRKKEKNEIAFWSEYVPELFRATGHNTERLKRYKFVNEWPEGELLFLEKNSIQSLFNFI